MGRRRCPDAREDLPLTPRHIICLGQVEKTEVPPFFPCLLGVINAPPTNLAPLADGLIPFNIQLGRHDKSKDKQQEDPRHHERFHQTLAPMSAFVADVPAFRIGCPASLAVPGINPFHCFENSSAHIGKLITRIKGTSPLNQAPSTTDREGSHLECRIKTA